jgi:hypothetical protein
VTIRHGPEVRREHFDSLDDAIGALRSHVEAIRSEGPLGSLSALRDFEPSQRVHARLEISTGGLLHSRDAGIDLMGDGSVIPYTGAMRRKELELRGGESPFDALGQALSGGDP